MLRIMQIIGGSGLRLRAANAPPSLEKKEGSTFLDARANILYWFRGPRHWDPMIDLSAFRTIGHFRDPRDLACNQYWWALQHPNTIDTPEVAEAKRQKTEAMGIDKYALGRNNRDSYGMLMGLSHGAMGDVMTWTSYTQLCCAFDYMVDNLCHAFNRAPSQVAEELRLERPENLGGNADWVKVGGTWKGSDVTPGRFRNDLTPETVAEITAKHAEELAFCKMRDASFLRHHYL
ncbi:hypothetical protein [Roseococcus sp.]|uniref:hypothetical protein n=1 Tax=Roseococcus sp. TaxID=2109646 RepID=UPI003BAB37F8